MLHYFVYRLASEQRHWRLRSHAKTATFAKGFLLPAFRSRRIYVRFYSSNQKKINPLDDDAFDDDFLKATREALFERKKEIADEFTKSRYGMSYIDFYNTGLSKMPPDLFREAMAYINRIDLKTDCVLAGFANKFPVLIETSADGEAMLNEEFATVGSGSPLATASLMHRQYTDAWPIPRCLYAIFEAKKYSEGVGSVGKRTMISVITPDGKVRDLSPNGEEELEAQYKKFGPKTIPYDLKIDPGFLKYRE